MSEVVTSTDEPVNASTYMPRLELTYALAFVNVVGMTVGAVPFWAGTGGLNWVAWLLCPLTPTALMWPILTMVLAVLMYSWLAIIARHQPRTWPAFSRRIVLTISLLWLVLIGIWFAFTFLLMR